MASLTTGAAIGTELPVGLLFGEVCEGRGSAGVSSCDPAQFSSLRLCLPRPRVDADANAVASTVGASDIS